MSDNKLQKRFPGSLKEKGQYFLAFGVVASMLLVAGFPVFVIFFFGIFAFFLLKMFTAGTRNETREIFEFYLSANEILRDDERKWFGFEIKETIGRGEAVVSRMSGAPPLVYFALGALYNKIGDHKAAVNNLSFVAENESSREASYVFPSPELRNYVKVLRKIEREPADAPLTSSAIRALERARSLRAKTLLEDSRVKFAGSRPIEVHPQLNGAADKAVAENGTGFEDRPLWAEAESKPAETKNEETPSGGFSAYSPNSPKKRQTKKEKEDPYANRKPISEVLHDIYDKNVQ